MLAAQWATFDCLQSNMARSKSKPVDGVSSRDPMIPIFLDEISSQQHLLINSWTFLFICICLVSDLFLGHFILTQKTFHGQETTQLEESLIFPSFSTYPLGFSAQFFRQLLGNAQLSHSKCSHQPQLHFPQCLGKNIEESSILIEKKPAFYSKLLARKSTAHVIMTKANDCVSIISVHM